MYLIRYLKDKTMGEVRRNGSACRHHNPWCSLIHQAYLAVRLSEGALLTS